MAFSHVRIDDRPPCGRLGFCEPADLTGNGLPDVIIGGMGRTGAVNLFGKRLKLRQLPVSGWMIKRLESNVFWYENPGWERHDVARSPDLSVGGSVGDLDGDGTPELVVGQNDGTELYWFDPGADPRRPWRRHLITDEFRKYHDTAIADVDGDGEDEVLILSQRSEVVCYYDVPDDPTTSPWPSDHRHVIDRGLHVEGAAVADLDADGFPEVIAGPNVYDRNGTGAWTRRTIDPEWRWTRVAVAPLNGTSQSILMTEGDLPYQEDRPGRLGIVEPDSLAVTVLDDDLFCPHTLQVGDVTGTGSLDILVGEMGLGRNPEPRLLCFQNDGAGSFDRIELDRGIPTHEGKLLDLTGNGELDIVSKSYGPACHVDLWLQS